MSAPNFTAVPSVYAPGATPATAVLLLNATGRITASNSSARTLWQVSESELIGEPFASLLFFEVTSDGPEWIETQWEAVLGAALDRSALLSIQPRKSAPHNQSIRIEPALGGFGGYIVAVQSPAPSPTVADPRDEGLGLLVEHGVVGLFDLNFKAGHIVYSQVWKKLLGYASAELPDTHDTWLTRIHPEDSEAAPYFIGKKHTTGARRIFVEFRMRHRLGHYVWLQCTGLQQISPAGQLERVTGFCLDVSERRELEEASLAGDSRFQDLSVAGPLGAFEFDFLQSSHWVSPAWRRLLGLSPDEPHDALSAFTAALPSDHAALGLATWLTARATPGETSFVESVELRQPDGRAVSMLLGAHRTFNRKRELTRVVGFISPLPAGVAAVSLGDGPALEAPLLIETFSALAEAVLLTDPAGRVLFINHAAARLLGRDPADALGRPLDDIFRLANRLTGRPGENPFQAALAAEGPLPLDSEHTLLPEHLFNQTSSPFALTEPPATPGPGARPIVWSARAVYGSDRRVRGVILLFRDPQEMSLTPDELVKANRFDMLGQLAGGIAHDFNNLLTTILGTISLAVQTQDPGPLADAEQACLAAKGLTKQLLLVAKGGVAIQSIVDPREILDDAVKLAAAGLTADVTISVASGTSAVAVDRAQILQVFQNLVLNALQAMPPPPHAARVQLCARNLILTDEQIPGLPAGDYVEFESRDNGGGIPPEYLEKIWDPFFTTKKHGTGLGLATVLSIVRKHGGQIGLLSTVGVGTVFTLYLPRADRPVDVQARKAPSLRFGTGRILFMDDDDKISELSGGMLGSLDYKYDLAKTGEEAIALYQRYLNIGRPYDAVVMDLTIVGGMGGEECFRRLRQLDPDVRAVVSSGYDNDDMARRYLEMGFCGYLTKPYRVADLGKILKTVLN